MFSNGKIDFEYIVPSYLQSRAGALFSITFCESFRLTVPVGGRRLATAVTVDSQSVYFGLYLFCLSFPTFGEFNTVVVRFKIGANMNLAAANPGQRAGAGPADWVASFAFLILPVLPVSIAIVFASRRRLLFVLLILSRFLVSCFRKLKPFVPEFSHCFWFESFENLHTKFTILCPLL